jgi:hypothetical protein
MEIASRWCTRPTSLSTIQRVELASGRRKTDDWCTSLQIPKESEDIALFGWNAIDLVLRNSDRGCFWEDITHFAPVRMSECPPRSVATFLQSPPRVGLASAS